MSKLSDQSSRKTKRATKTPWHLAIVVGLLIAGIAVGITNEPLRILSPSKRSASRSLGQPPAPPAPDANDPSKEYIYGGLIATEAGKSNQAITFGTLINKTYRDADFGVSATPSSGLTVAFAASGNCVVSGSVVHITGTITPPGQTEDSSYLAAAPIPERFTIAPSNQTITFGGVANKTYCDADFGVSAIVAMLNRCNLDRNLKMKALDRTGTGSMMWVNEAPKTLMTYVFT